MSDLDPEPMWEGTIVDGADSIGRGAAPVSGITIAGDNGQQLQVGYRPPDTAIAVRATLLREIPYHQFDVCPICGDTELTSHEHVPPEKLGGQVQTLCCDRCNNRLGSHLEAALLDWRDDAVRGSTASAPDVMPGKRKIARLLVRRASTGEPVYVLDQNMDPAVRLMLQHGGFEWTWTRPDPNRVRLGALKSAYLAACLNLREIPMTATADVIRRDLVAARDAPSGRAIPTSAVAGQLSLMRSFAAPRGPSLALMSAPATDPDMPPEVWISLAGTVFVRWPLPDVSPRL